MSYSWNGSIIIFMFCGLQALRLYWEATLSYSSPKTASQSMPWGLFCIPHPEAGLELNHVWLLHLDYCISQDLKTSGICTSSDCFLYNCFWWICCTWSFGCWYPLGFCSHPPIPFYLISMQVKLDDWKRTGGLNLSSLDILLTLVCYIMYYVKH